MASSQQQRPLPYNKETTATTVAADNAANIAGKIVLTTGVSPNGLGACKFPAEPHAVSLNTQHITNRKEGS